MPPKPPLPHEDQPLTERTLTRWGAVGVSALSAVTVVVGAVWTLRGDVVMRSQLDTAIKDVADQALERVNAQAKVIDAALAPITATLKDTSDRLGKLREEVAELRGEIRGRSSSASR